MALSIDDAVAGMRNSMKSSMSGGTGGGSEYGQAKIVTIGCRGTCLSCYSSFRPTVVYIEPGHVGIVIHRGGGGVDDTPLGPGMHMRNPLFTSIEEYPTFMQTIVLSKSSSEEGSADER